MVFLISFDHFSLLNLKIIHPSLKRCFLNKNNACLKNAIYLLHTLFNLHFIITCKFIGENTNFLRIMFIYYDAKITQILKVHIHVTNIILTHLLFINIK